MLMRLFGKMPYQPRPYGIGSPQLNGATVKLRKTDEKCVVCQYVVQRLHSKIVSNGLAGRQHFSRSAEAWRRHQQQLGVPNQFSAPPASDGSGSGASGASSAGSGSSSFLEVDHSVSVRSELSHARSELTDDPGAAAAAAATAAAVAAAAATPPPPKPKPSRLRRLGNAALRLLGFNPPKPPADMMYQSPLVSKFIPHDPPALPMRSVWAWKSGRERNDDFYAFRPEQTRYAHLYDLAGEIQKRSAERFQNQQIMSEVYQMVERMCTTNMPKEFYPYCGTLMRKYQFIARSLMWKDRPDAICQQLDLCDSKSYIQKGPHGGQGTISSA